jgi:signal transduction histidine kinase/CheY-like chemotaxis protein
MIDRDDREVVGLLRQQAILAKFGEHALRSDNLDEILTEACRLVGEAFGTDLAKVVELREDGETLLVRAGIGWKPGVVGVAVIKVAENTSEGLSVKTGKPVISPDIETETRFEYPRFLTENGVRAVANVLIIGGRDRRPFGILQVDSREPRQFTDNDTTFLTGYANLVAAVVDRLRILDDLRQSEAQLRQSQKLEAIGRLAAGVAHDFNNILQSISSSIELVLDDIEPGTATHEAAEIALSSAQRGASLTHHLLSYACRQVLQPAQMSVVQFLIGMKQLLGRTLGKHIVVEVQEFFELPVIFADPGQLQTAILNLAINAAHAMPEGGTLLLAADLVKEDPSYVVISVADTGTGMDTETLAQAFEPFFSTKGQNGSGLGLSMVQGFAEQSGGRVNIVSALGKGTKVELRLPQMWPAKYMDKQQAGSAYMRGSGCILLVDDTPDVLVTTGAFLIGRGFSVVRVGTGDEALAYLASNGQVDALVSDYAMPGINGVDLIEQARAIRPDLVALIITGYADSTTVDRISESITVVKKPFKRDQLIEALVGALDRGHPAAQGEMVTSATRSVPGPIAPISATD